MVKEKRILSYFIGWLIIGLLICFIGITNVFADEMEKIGFLSDKTDIQIVVPYNGTPLTLDQYGEYYLTEVDQLLVFIDNYNFIGGNIYQLELYLPNATLTNANMFTVSGTTSTNESVSCNAIKILQDNKQYVNYRWRCNKTVDSLTFTIKNSNNENIVSAGTFRWDYSFLWNVLSTTDNSEIIAGLDKVEDAIIESNKETQEVIKDQFNSCRDSYNLFNISNLQNGYETNYSLIGNGFNAVGALYVLYPFNVSSGTYTLSYDYKINSGNASVNTGKFRLRYIDGSYSIFYTSGSSFTINKELKEIMFYTDNATEIMNIDYTNIMLQKGSVATTYEPYGEEICSNKIDETNDKLDGIQGALTDSSAPNISGLENSAGWLPAGPLDSILNLPLTMLNSLTNSLGKTCSPLNLTLPYVNKNIQIPCLSAIFAQITGVNGLWTWVGTIASVLILYNYLLNLYAWVDRVLTLRAEFDEAMGADLANWGRL